ncbi:MAG: epoxyqueuosine reductase QueH [Clostridia bacterium]|nr:epoxyqueuosine reductase QueH [Clostridia bacterium]
MNYQKAQDEITASLTGRPRLLLHACCGPCSTACIERLAEHFDVTVFWYDPCIHPEKEYLLRLEHAKKLAEAVGVPLIEAEYDPENYFARVKGLENEPEGGARCTECFRQRLERTAQAAREGGFAWFTTTLTVSPHKDAPRINGLGEEIGKAAGVPFLPSDFKKKNGYLRSIELSKRYGLYRQDYCGCVFSMRPREEEAEV